MTITPSVATICFDGFGDEDFEPTFRHAPELGILDIEFNAWYPRNLTPGGLERIVERCQRIGAQVATLQVSPFGGGLGSGDLTREVSRWLWLLEAAGRLGTRVVKATGSARGDRAGLDAVIDVLRVVAPVAENAGVTLAIENHFDNVIEYPEDYREIFAAVPSPAVGMCLDTGHFVASGVELSELVEEFTDRIVHVDLKDCAGPGAAKFVRFGTGVVDFDSLLRAVTAHGFSGYLVVELPLIDADTMLDDLRAGAKIARRFSSMD